VIHKLYIENDVEVVVTYFKMESQHLPGGIKHKRSGCTWIVSLSMLRSCSSQACCRHVTRICTQCVCVRACVYVCRMKYCSEISACD